MKFPIVAILADRLTKNIVDYFLNRYSVTERQRVETIVIDLNAQYASFIHQLFPNAEIIIDRFHTQQDAVDLILRKYPNFARVYETYQGLQSALKQRDVDELNSAIFAYENTKTAMDQTIRTLRHSAHYIANSAKYDYSNGPLEGINRKIKNLKRSCCGFRNFENLLRRINCIRA